VGIAYVRESIARWVFFQYHPELEREHSITMSCGDKRCVRAAHCRRGVLNPRNHLSVE
jgi:hypothetical protein